MKKQNQDNKPVCFEDYKICSRCGRAGKRITRETRIIKDFSDGETNEVVSDTFICLNPKCKKGWSVNVFATPLTNYR